ncbi:MAG: hypothetical protein PHW02_08375 [bacterium]|nr:hypothetical protein [bacterium]
MSLKKATLFTFSNYISLFSALFQGLITAAILSTESMGSYSQIRITVSYMMFLNPGIINGLTMVMPGENHAERQSFASAALTFSFLLSLFSITWIFPAYIFTKNYLWLYAGGVFAFSSAKETLAFSLRSMEMFGRYSAINAVSALSQALLTIFFAWIWGLKGALFGLLSSSALSLLFSVLMTPFPLEIKIIPSKLRILFARGKTIYINGAYSLILSTFERFFLSFAVEKSLFAVYSVGAFFLSFFDMLSTSMTQYLTPKMVRERESFDQNRMRGAVRMVLFSSSLLMILSMVMLKYLVPLFLAKYSQSVKIASVLAVTSLYQIYFGIMYAKYLSENKLARYFPIQTVGAAITALSVILFFFSGKKNDLMLFSYMILSVRTVYFLSAVLYFRRTMKINLASLGSFSFLAVCALLFIALPHLNKGWTAILCLLASLPPLFVTARFLKWI